LMTFAGQRRAPVASSIDLMQLIERAVSMCRRTFQSRVQLETSTALSSAHVSGDPIAIEQVLVNMLVNARDAVAEVERTDAYIRVELSLGPAQPPDSARMQLDSYYCIRIEDNGVGMSDAVKQRLFEPFFTTKKPGKGTGLGLATSYGIVRDLGGFISVESQPLEGTSVSVFLPPAAARSLSAPAASSEARSAPCSTILVIDDEPAVRRVVELILRQSGHHVHLAPDGQAGVAQLDAGLRPDLIVLDRSMPGWAAKVTLAELRKRAEHVPILFFTGQEVTSEERAQVQDVLYKPLSPKELMRSVERWLEKR
jgi:two-component system cell cycle sensor histidine kinase/response regulator CckA